MRLRFFTASVFAALLLTACGGAKTGGGGGNAVAATSGQLDSSALDELDRPTPMDPSIRTGVLPNGLTYYVKEHRQPNKRAHLWLGVNAGATLEEDQQQGLAHFVEHMAFNGTKNFEKDAIVKYFESVGMEFGPDLNAHTNQDETVYKIQVPTDDAKIVDTGLRILREWAGNISFDATEVDKERGVVVEEWRLRRGAGERIFSKQLPVIFKGSRYAERDVIGSEEILRTAPRAELVRFYKDWYRPNLMAVVAVGDFDGAGIEKQIKAVFGDLKNPVKPRKRETFPVPDHKEPLVSIETDPELTRNIVRVIIKNERMNETTLRDYRNGYIRDVLFAMMVRGRFSDLRDLGDAPFLFASASNGEMTRTKGAFRATAAAKNGKVTETLAVLWEELERIKQHGFTATELERARKQLLRSRERAALEMNKERGRGLAAEYLRNFFEEEQVPGRGVEYEYAKRFAPEITLEELNGLVATFTSPTNRIIVISGPASEKMPSQTEVVKLLRSVEGKALKPYSDEVSAEPLMTVKPPVGAITGENTIAELGVTEWKLSNGARVIVKPTNFKNDQILLRAFSPGGTSLVANKQYAAVRGAARIVDGGGIGHLNRTQLRKLLAGRVASASTYVAELEEGMTGSASPRDLEVMFQLAHLRFTAARKDKTAFEAWKTQQKEFVRNMLLRPETAFFDQVSKVWNKNHPRRRTPTVEDFDKTDLDKSYDFYRERFSDASDFTFTIVGNIDLAKLRPLVETYLASLPSSSRKETWRDVGVRHPGGVRTTTVKQGNEPKARVQVRFHGNQKWTREAANDIAMLSEALGIRLREVMREDMGGVYGVRSSGGLARRPKGRWTYTLSFGCDPARVDELKKALFAEIKNVQKSGLGEDYVEKIKTIRTRQREVSIETNRFWANRLQDAYRHGDDPREILQYQKWIDAVSSKRIQAAAKRYARSNQYHLSVLLPESRAK